MHGGGRSLWFCSQMSSLLHWGSHIPISASQTSSAPAEILSSLLPLGATRSTWENDTKYLMWWSVFPEVLQARPMLLPSYHVNIVLCWDTSQLAITSFPPACNILHAVAFCLQLVETSSKEKKTRLKCSFLHLMTIQFHTGICFRILGCLCETCFNACGENRKWFCTGLIIHVYPVHHTSYFW